MREPVRGSVGDQIAARLKGQAQVVRTQVAHVGGNKTRVAAQAHVAALDLARRRTTVVWFPVAIVALFSGVSEPVSARHGRVLVKGVVAQLAPGQGTCFVVANVVDFVARRGWRITEIEGHRAKPLDAGIVLCIFVWEGVDWIVEMILWREGQRWANLPERKQRGRLRPLLMDEPGQLRMRWDDDKPGVRHGMPDVTPELVSRLLEPELV